ncbi:MAG: tetratricopeptide repeat protein [Acidobacteriota bacterium]
MKITDHQEQPVANAEVRLVKADSGEGVATLSSAEGLAALEAATPGEYKLMVRKAGYMPLVMAHVQVGDAATQVEPKLVTQPVFDKWSSDAEAAVKRKKYKEALALYQQILAYFPQDAGFWANLATTYQMDGDLEEAMEAVEKAAHYDPQYDRLEKEIVGIAAHEVGKKYLAQREFPKAVRYFTRSVTADPTYAPAFYGLALSYANQGMYPQALENVQKALELSPNDSQYKSIEERLKNLVGRKQ